MNEFSIFEKWFPVTHDFGLIEAPVDDVSRMFQSWWEDSDRRTTVETVSGSLDEQFHALLPLCVNLNRSLVLPTTSNWTAFFRNGIMGSGPSSTMPVLTKQLGVRSMRLCRTSKLQKYAAVIWEVYEPNDLPGQRVHASRSIAAANDGGSWVFETSGEPYPFERTERYSLPRKRDRFTRELLAEYASHLGVPAIGDSLFDFDSPLEGRLISLAKLDRFESYTLEEVVARVPWKE